MSIEDQRSCRRSLTVSPALAPAWRVMRPPAAPFRKRNPDRSPHESSPNARRRRGRTFSCALGSCEPGLWSSDGDGGSKYGRPGLVLPKNTFPITRTRRRKPRFPRNAPCGACTFGVSYPSARRPKIDWTSYPPARFTWAVLAARFAAHRFLRASESLLRPSGVIPPLLRLAFART